MAEQLVGGMTGKWNPSQYKDTYQSDLMALIQKKVKGGKVETPPDMEFEEVTDTNAEDLASLLQRSLRGKKTKPLPRKTKARSKSAGKSAHARMH